MIHVQFSPPFLFIATALPPTFPRGRGELPTASGEAWEQRPELFAPPHSSSNAFFYPCISHSPTWCLPFHHLLSFTWISPSDGDLQSCVTSFVLFIVCCENPRIFRTGNSESQPRAWPRWIQLSRILLGVQECARWFRLQSFIVDLSLPPAESKELRTTQPLALDIANTSLACYRILWYF